MPDAAVNVVRAGSSTSLSSIAADKLVPLLLLERPNSAREQAGAYQVEQASRDDEENLQLGASTTPVHDVADDATNNEANKDRQGDRGSGCRERNSGNKDNSLDTLTQNSDEGQEEHGVFFKKVGEATASRLVGDGRVDSLGQLHAPLVLHFSNAEKGSAHDGDDDGSQQAEGTLVV